ncbi:MAG: hypothetical protein COW02_11950 [Comamonadaceae bacterium CG12_big_fil_rev_8_21_14_0_65_59_15]|nr:MAG: hypothetical protein COW02_11950 [Comamonadaceae bacterium CG12_big_fil_rev_8_21_14_0_65_59_15]
MSEYVPVIYLVNRDNLLTEVNEGWAAFAQANQGDAIPASAVLGRSVLEFVSGKVTKQYWQNLLERARASDKPVQVDYRCDAPLLKRWMRMELQVLEGGSLRISHQQIAQQARARPIYFARSQQRGKYSYVRCSLCNKIKVAEQWLEPDCLSEGTASNTVINVTYGLCGKCSE